MRKNNFNEKEKRKKIDVFDISESEDNDEIRK